MKEKGTERVDNTPVSHRLNLSNATVRMFDARLGWNGFRTCTRDYFGQAGDQMTTSGTGVRNVFLANLADLGMVANALCTFALVAGVGKALWRIQPPELLPWRTALLALAVAWRTLANLSLLNTSFPDTILWMWASVVCRPRVPSKTMLRREPERPAPGPIRAGVAA